MKFVHTADTHLGFHHSKSALRDPTGRRKRDRAIFKNFLAIIRHVTESGADALIHSGDLFNKDYIEPSSMDELVKPLIDLARDGIPVLIIPGNHERSSFPFDLFHGAGNIYVFDRPKSVLIQLNGYSVAFCGFPFLKNDSRRTFFKALEETGHEALRADIKVLLTHQAFDQATVGPGNFVFGPFRPDTVPREKVPVEFDYVAAGHIHRYQMLPHPLNPELNFVYPGSIQRMSFAEMGEEKGFIEAEAMDVLIVARFVPLEAYRMETVEIEAAGLSASDCERAIRSQFWRLGHDMVIRFNLTGGQKASDYPDVAFDLLRSTMPEVLECQFALKVARGWLLR